MAAHAVEQQPTRSASEPSSAHTESCAAWAEQLPDGTEESSGMNANASVLRVMLPSGKFCCGTGQSVVIMGTTSELLKVGVVVLVVLEAVALAASGAAEAAALDESAATSSSAAAARASAVDARMLLFVCLVVIVVVGGPEA